jgi:O-antigen ligase
MALNEALKQGAGRPRVWSASLAVVIVYITFVTEDLDIGPIPFKVFLIALAMVAWWLQVGRRRSLRDYQLAVPVLLFSIAIPIVWAIVAGLQAIDGDGVGLHQLRWTLQEASHFVYLLLYFPLLDARRVYGRRGLDLWLYPVLGLCVATILLCFSHYLFGSPSDTTEFFVFRGVFQSNDGGFRVFIGNQVLFVAGTALLLAELAAMGRSRLRIGGLALLITATYLSHTRGIWSGMSIVCAATLLVMFWRQVDSERQLLTLRVVGGVALVVAAIGIGVLFGALPRPSFLADNSAGLREQQAPKLWDAFKGNPVFGDGLGSVVRPRYVRDPTAPWSYELIYLQLLFQMGVIGLLAVLALPLAAIRRGLKDSVTGPLRAPPLAGTTAILGILVASATNPYLLSSFGMLCVAIGISLVARPGAAESPPLREAAPAPA